MFDKLAARPRILARPILLLATIVVLVLISAPVSADEDVDAQKDLEAARARSQYFLSLLRCKSERPLEAINLLRQIPQTLRGIEWYLTHGEFYGGDITCYGHTNEVNSVVFSPDGSLVASGGADNRARLWDARTGRELRVWQGLDVEPNAARSEVGSVRFSPDGSKLAAACGYGSDIGFKGQIKIWDVKTGKLLNKLDDPRWIRSIAFSPDGKRIAYGSVNAKAGKVWDVESGKTLTLKMIDEMTYIPWVLSPDGKVIAVGERGRRKFIGGTGKEPCSVKLWDARTGKEIHTCDGHIHSISSLAFSPDSARFTSADGTGTIKVWDAKTGKELKTISGNGSLQFTPDGVHLVYRTSEKKYEDRSLRFLNIKTGKTVALKDPQRPIYGGVLSPDGTSIAGMAGNRIKLWDVRTGETIKTLKGHVQGYQRMDFSPDGAWLVTGGDDQTVRLWDCRILGDGWTVGSRIRKNSEKVSTKKLNSHESSYEIAFSPDGKRVATAGEAIQISDARDGRKLRELKTHTDRVTCVAFSPDGKLLASASKDKTTRVWEVATGKELAVLKGQESPVASVAFHHDGTRLVTGDYNKLLCTWDWRAGKQLMQAEDKHDHRRGSIGKPKPGSDYIKNVAWSPDGNWILSLYHSNESFPYVNVRPTYDIRLWDASTGKKVATLKGHRSAAISAAFSPDSRWIASASDDSTIRIWDVRAHEEVKLIDGHDGRVQDVAFTPDSSRIVSTAVDGTVRVWDRASGEELKAYGDTKEHAQRRRHYRVGHRNRVAITASGDQILARRGNKIESWSARPTERVRMLQGVELAMALGPNGKLVAAINGDSINLWDATTGKKLISVLGNGPLAFNQDGTRLLTGGGSKSVKMWDTSTGTELRKYTTTVPYLRHVAFHPNGKSVLAENSFDRRVAWDIESGDSVTIAQADWPHEALDPQHRSSDGRWLLTPLGGYVRVADTQFTSGKEQQSHLHSKTTRSALWHQQQATIAEKKSNWFAAAFHRAWQLKIDPNSKDAREALQRAHKELNQAIVPVVVSDVLGNGD